MKMESMCGRQVSGIQRRFCLHVYGLFGKFEDLNMPDTVLGSGTVKTNRTFIQYLLNTYRCCVLVIALWELPSQQDKSGTKSRTV